MTTGPTVRRAPCLRRVAPGQRLYVSTPGIGVLDACWLRGRRTRRNPLALQTRVGASHTHVVSVSPSRLPLYTPFRRLAADIPLDFFGRADLQIEVSGRFRLVQQVVDPDTTFGAVADTPSKNSQSERRQNGHFRCFEI